MSNEPTLNNPEPTSIAATKPPATIVRKRLLTQERLFKSLCRYDRTAFMELLAQFLDCAPTPEAIHAFANQHPDRWMTASKALAGVGGFTTERIEASVDVANLDEMSDSQLRARLQEALLQLRHSEAIPLQRHAAEEAQTIDVAPQPHCDQPATAQGAAEEPREPKPQT
jgi:hypothetical protein